MARYVLTVRTPMAPADAFAYLADLSNFDEWDPGVSRAEQVAGDGPGVGAAYELDASGATLRYEVDLYEPPRAVRARARNAFVTSVDTITVEPDGDAPGSLVTYDADLTLNGVLKVGDPLLKLAFDRIGDKAATGLTQRLEGQRVR